MIWFLRSARQLASKGADGYYNKTGTFRLKDGKVGYYDKYGIHEGTNPYKTGCYDAEGNFHPFDEDGYFDSDLA